MFNKNNRIYWLVIIGLIAVWLLIYAYLDQRTAAATESRLKERTVTQQIAWQAAINTYNHSTQTYYDQLINKPKVWTLLKQAKNPQESEQARDALIKHLSPTNEYLTKQGIRQFHFHTPDNHSFIRFHYLQKWGDDLTEARPSVRWTNQNKQPYFGFETGRVFSGFRHVFPIIDDQGQHLGSVELSFPFEKIRLEANQLLPDRKFRMVIAENDLMSKLFAGQSQLYSRWSVNPTFYVEDRLSQLKDSPPAFTSREVRLNEYLKTEPKVQHWLNNGKEGSLAFFLDNEPHSVTLTPIYNTVDQLSGYLVGYRPAPELTMARSNFKTSLLISTLATGLLGLFVILWLRHKRQHLQGRQFIKTIYDTMGEGLYVLDQYGIITHINRKAIQMLGFSESELMGKNAHDLFHLHTLDKKPTDLTECAIQASIFQQDIYEDVVKFKTKNAQVLTVKVVSQPLISEGALQGSVTTFMDISREQSISDELKLAKEKAESANHAKSEFLANMSHEIRTPLNAVIGLSELMLETKLSTHQADYLNKINQSSQLLLSVINDILDYSKIEAGKLELSPQAFYLKDIFEQLTTLFQQAAHKKGLGFILDIDPQLPDILYGDDLRLLQILTNLTSNAIKFTPHGEVRLTAKLIESLNRAFKIEFRVCDTGIGLSQEQIHKLFKPFAQADNSTTRHYGGTGLGLVISQRLVKAMGGSHLSIESQLDHGACFVFTLNFEKPQTEQAVTHYTNQTSQSLLKLKFSGHVLLAEDNEINQIVASQILQKAGFRVTIVQNGQQAVEAAQSEKFDGIFMDLQMPIKSGYQASIEIRKHNPDIPIIALTAAALVEDRDKAQAAGMNDHLSKPIEMSALYAALVQWLGHLQILNYEPSDLDEASQTHPPKLTLPAQLDGFDLVLGKKRLKIADDLYTNLLIEFAAQLATDKQLLEKELDLNRLHAIKGVSGNLAAMNLFKAASDLEQALKKPDASQDIEKLKQTFFDSLSVVHKSLRQWLGQSRLSDQDIETQDQSLHKPDELIIKLNQGDLLTKQEVQSLVYWAKSRTDKPTLVKLKQALQSLDYKAAFQIVSKF
ncbi:MAG: response regulator [Thiomicrospira sp.]|uniref:response regulator n=1 Tax=Thiomicrospira sp. TaxID=935 RepID=UPI001A0F1DAA|nr:response regulator [Thiomicrospira sp.]MBE0493828.1 response regulator [Thiomicrospira sp.]